MPKFSRDFGSPAPIEREVEFKLHGQTFKCVGDITAGVFEDYLGSMRESTQPDGASFLFVPLSDQITFIDSCIVDDETRDLFHKIRHAQHVPTDVLNDIKEYLIETYSERPTAEPSPSTDGSAANGSTSPASAGEPG